MKNTEKRYMTIKEAMEYTGMGELTLLGILADIDVYPVQPGGSGTRRFVDKTDIPNLERQGTSYTTHTKRTAPVLIEILAKKRRSKNEHSTTGRQFS